MYRDKVWEVLPSVGTGCQPSADTQWDLPSRTYSSGWGKEPGIGLRRRIWRCEEEDGKSHGWCLASGSAKGGGTDRVKFWSLAA